RLAKIARWNSDRLYVNQASTGTSGPYKWHDQECAGILSCMRINEMLTLGINYGSHDSAAAIASGGKILFAIAEERLSRKKHDGGFPVLAIGAALAHAGGNAR